MLSVTEEAREYLANLLEEVREHVTPDTCFRIDLSDPDDPLLSFSEEKASDRSIVFEGRVILVWDDEVERDAAERALVLYEDLGAAGESLFLVWPQSDGRPAARGVTLSEDVREALEEIA